MIKDQIRGFIIKFAREVLTVDLDADDFSAPVFSLKVQITPWGVIHIIEAINNEFNFRFDVSEIASNHLFSINDMTDSIYKQLTLCDRYSSKK